MFLSEWREFPSAPCLAEKMNLTTVRVSMLLKSLASLTCFFACFLPGRAKDLSAPRVYLKTYHSEKIKKTQNEEARIFHNTDKKRTKSKKWVPLAKQWHACVEKMVKHVFFTTVTGNAQNRNRGTHVWGEKN